MIRLTSAGDKRPTLRLNVERAKYPLLQFIPCTAVNVQLGPPLVIEVPGHEVSELAPAVLAAVEAAVGCRLVAEDVAD